MDPCTTLVGLVVGMAAQVAPAPVPTRTKDPAVTPAPRSESGATGHRLRLVRATDQSPIVGAELFDVDGGREVAKALVRGRTIEETEALFESRARRLVSDGDGFVEAGPGRLHALLARAPGWFQLHQLTDLERDLTGTVELVPDEPLAIEIRSAHDEPVEGLFVELLAMEACGSGTHFNSTWRVASDGSGRVSLPHYRWWLSDDFVVRDQWLEVAVPMNEPPRFDLNPIAFPAARGLAAALANPPPEVVWRMPPMSRVHVEFEGKEALPSPLVATFELIGPRQIFGEPDRFTSRDGAAIDVPAEVDVPLQARFRWEDVGATKWRPREHFALGRAMPHEGGVATMRVFVAGDPVSLRLDPRVTASHGVSVSWKDSRGFEWRDLVRAPTPDETGAIRFEWRRPRLGAEERPATIHVALRPNWHRYGWEPLNDPELAACDVPWPTGAEVDVGTMSVPSAK